MTVAGFVVHDKVLGVKFAYLQADAYFFRSKSRYQLENAANISKHYG
jgi:hypothetical protein